MEDAAGTVIIDENFHLEQEQDIEDLDFLNSVAFVEENGFVYTQQDLTDESETVEELGNDAISDNNEEFLDEFNELELQNISAEKLMPCFVVLINCEREE